MSEQPHKAAYPTPPPGGLIAGDPRPDTVWAGVSEEVREESARLLDRAAGIPERDPYACQECGCHHHTTAQHYDRDLWAGGEEWDDDDE